MNYKYYFIIYRGVPAGGKDLVIHMQLGSKEELGKLRSDAIESWESYEEYLESHEIEESYDDPQIWERESDCDYILGRGNDMQVLTEKFYEIIKEKFKSNIA